MPIRKVLGSLRASFATAPAIVLLAACASGPFDLQAVAGSSGLAPSGPTRVQARCPPAMKLIGGGLLVNRDYGLLINENHPQWDNGLVVVQGSYPTSDNAWEVEVLSVQPFPGDITTVSAIAYCLSRPSGFSPAIGVYHRSGAYDIGLGTQSQSLRVRCPRGRVLTGGGFRIDDRLDATDAQHNGGILASEPEKGGWRLDLGQGVITGQDRPDHPPRQRDVTAYAICALAPILPGTIVSAAYVPSDSGPFGAEPIASTGATIEVTCPQSRQFVTAGGFRLEQDSQRVHYATTSAATSGFSSWTVHAMVAGGRVFRPETVALCLTRR